MNTVHLQHSAFDGPHEGKHIDFNDAQCSKVAIVALNNNKA